MAISGVSIFVVGIALLVSVPLSQQNEEVHLKFSYSGETGPDKWGSLKPEFSTCSTGKLQSPVNIVTKDVIYNPKLQPLNRDYRTSNSTLINHGYSIGLFYGSDKVGVMIHDGKNYTLKQVHWHSPSEHTINGIRYPLELHQVHIADDGSISVVGVLYNYGAPDLLLLQIKSKLDELAKEACGEDEIAKIPIGHMGTKYLRRGAFKYYRYVGSLTTPPCTQNVTWTIIAKVREVSKEQIEALTAPLEGSCKSNSRPVQALYGRKIELYNAMPNKI
ncbi:alpha carbonic anhydrase 1, chloroplastic-like [Macadamia integrifolia]|uniref:alpha carbonic anhydrase 1, chloroplastic-like n=1 Tax=Macadamia integrifolia TaxID=60698 RepID=UPI001C531808|nr:alpha carbonic anhydrase 1, chloroplastic-like [Macadamia integrifolia]